MLNTNQKIEHLRKLGFNGDFEQIERMYNGEKFDVRDEEYRRLLQLSKEYCMRFTQLSELISRAKSAEEIENYNKEKSEILDNLFPGHLFPSPTFQVARFRINTSRTFGG